MSDGVKRVPGSPEWKQHVAELLEQERKQPLGWWYISFAGETEFLGGVVIEAHGFTDAIAKTHRLGINPGGQAGGTPVPGPGPFPTNKLLSRAEMEAIENAAMAAKS